MRCADDVAGCETLYRLFATALRLPEYEEDDNITE